MIDLGGFSISFAQRNSMVMIVILYTIVIVGLGLWVKWISNQRKDNTLASYLTGGGGLNAFEVAMFTVTSALAGGTMVGGPGLSYGFGYGSILAVYCGFAMNITMLGTVGKKTAIVGKRIHATTPLQLLRHRYQSKALVIVLAISFILFATAQSASNLMVAAKLFTAITGANSYLIGLLIAIVAIVIYTLSGGVKSLARVCVVQGVLMLASVLVLCLRQHGAINAQFGSIQAAMESVAQIKGSMLLANTWTPMYSISLSLAYGWVMFALPVAIQGNLTYNSSKVVSRSIIISLIVTTLLHLCMTGGAVLTFALNPNLTQPDYSVVYLATTLLPSGIAGFVVAGCFAAVQSTVATVLMLIAAAVAKDLYHDVINPNASEKTVSRLNTIMLIIVSLATVIIGMFPSDFTQILNVFASSGLNLTFLVTLLFGLYWRKATATGAIAASAGGVAAYIIFYFWSRGAGAEFWRNVLNNPHPLTPALVVSFILMLVFSPLGKKVPLGVAEVWFGEDYEEKYALQYNAE